MWMRDVDLIAETRQRFVDRVVDDLVDEMVQAGRPGRADVHRRPLADGFEAFENLDLVGGILGDVRGGAVSVLSGRHVGRGSRGFSRVLVFALFHQTRIGMMT